MVKRVPKETFFLSLLYSSLLLFNNLWVFLLIVILSPNLRSCVHDRSLARNPRNTEISGNFLSLFSDSNLNVKKSRKEIFEPQDKC